MCKVVHKANAVEVSQEIPGVDITSDRMSFFVPSDKPISPPLEAIKPLSLLDSIFRNFYGKF